jgi:hypothetical protein
MSRSSSRKEQLESDNKAVQISNLVCDSYKESKALQEFGTSRGVTQRSEEYNAEYRHVFASPQVVCEWKKSAIIAGAAAFGALYGFGVGRLPLQLAVGGLVAMFTHKEHVGVYNNEERTWKRWSGVPLVEGRSVLSDELCGDVVAKYLALKVGEEEEPVQSPMLQNIGLFVQNCQRRQAFEQRIRKDHGLDPLASVSIPPPGVPADYPIAGLETDSSFYEPPTLFVTDLDEKKLKKWIEDIVA